ncbi:hypothetical protein BGZ68_004874 [Mortierella alpina]|nr:hypothetical protein BGZ68_004874 [Mortierella alpina]
MSTFDGLIREFPTVAIDNFKIRPGVCVYLLSHVHSDHLQGLAARAWDAPIYCSQITAIWLPMLATRSKQTAFASGQDTALQRKYAHLARHMRPLATDVPHYLDLGNGRKARLNLIPAHHCPGAVMFLLQDDRSCILYTGDARNEAVDLQGLNTMPIFTSTTQQIDRLYLDTTCCHPAFKEFPSRDLAISDLITFINRRPRMAHYYIDAWTFGYEDIWIALSRAFHTKIHVSSYLYELYEAIDEFIHPKILPHLTLDGTTARFHSCRLDRTCGYGGAGGEHSSARELIRIQPNVSWFSESLNKDRVNGNDGGSVVAQGNVVGRSNSFKIKSRLPPCIGKRDDFCYYINFACHASLSELQQLVKLVSPKAIFPCVLHRDPIFQSLFSSNREKVALLAPHTLNPGFALDVEEYADRRPCLEDGITTDFQSFHHAKGYHILDMNDELLGVGPDPHGRHPPLLSDEPIDLDEQIEARAGITPTSTKGPSPILSPRSTHLRRKMNKLRRLLRNTVSLEEEEDFGGHSQDESTLGDGPLSLDFREIERKRNWWMQADRGPSTSLEGAQTGGDETDPLSSGIQSSGAVVDGLQGSGANGGDVVRSMTHDQAEKWYDESTVELKPNEVNLDSDHGIHSDRCGYISTSSVIAWSSEYLSSSPDPVFSTIPCSNSMSGAITALESAETPISNLRFVSSTPISSGSVQTIAAASVRASRNFEYFSIGNIPGPKPIPAAEFIVLSSSSSLTPSLPSLPSLPSMPLSLDATPPTASSLSPVPEYLKTPPRLSNHTNINLGESPSSANTAPASSKFVLPSSGPPWDYEPSGGIFAQLAWSPPSRRRPMQLTRAMTDPQHGPHRVAKKHFSAVKAPVRARTSVIDSGHEVILIESSDEDRATDDAEAQQIVKGSSTANGPRGCNQGRDIGEGFSSQDVACLEFDDVEGEDEFEL